MGSWSARVKEWACWWPVVSDLLDFHSHEQLGLVKFNNMKWIKVNRWIFTALYYKPFISQALRYGPCVSMWILHTVSPHTNHIPSFTPKLQGVTALWLVLIGPTHIGMARLSWPDIQCVSEKHPDIFSYNSRKHYQTFIIFGIHITEKIGNQ